MQPRPTLCFAIPCYNEALNIGPLLDKFWQLSQFYPWGVEVVVIDDASTDDTAGAVAKWHRAHPDFAVSIHAHATNRGLTGGINTAMELFAQRLASTHLPAGPVACGLLDGDNSHSPLVVPAMVDKICQGYDVVVASRYQLGSRIVGVSRIRQMLSLGLAIIFKIVRNIPGVRDYSCGFRLYSPRIIQLVRASYPGDCVRERSFASMVEILVKCHLLGALCTEVPFLLRYDLKRGLSKMPFLQTIRGNLKLLITLRKI